MKEQAQIEKIIAKARIDEGFKKRLLSDPAARLREEGVDVPPGVEVRIVEDTVNVQHLVLPTQPDDDELSEDALSRISAGIKRDIFP
jgi:hypothetical protein